MHIIDGRESVCPLDGLHELFPDQVDILGRKCVGQVLRIQIPTHNTIHGLTPITEL
jgi:hypothetical protein